MTSADTRRLFPDKAESAMRAEIGTILSKETISGRYMSDLTAGQRKGIIYGSTNLTNKYLPLLGDDGNRIIDKVKARLCAGGDKQDRSTFTKEESSSPTANITSIFAVAQIAAAEGRTVMIGDVGSAFLNAQMPKDDPMKLVFMRIAPLIAAINCDHTLIPEYSVRSLSSIS